MKNTQICFSPLAQQLRVAGSSCPDEYSISSQFIYGMVSNININKNYQRLLGCMGCISCECVGRLIHCWSDVVETIKTSVYTTKILTVDKGLVIVHALAIRTRCISCENVTTVLRYRNDGNNQVFKQDLLIACMTRIYVSTDPALNLSSVSNCNIIDHG